MALTVEEMIVGQLGQIQIELTKIHSSLDGIKSDVARVEVQALKTNGRVNKHDLMFENLTQQHKDCPIRQIEDIVYLLEDKVKTIETTKAIENTDEYKTGKFMKGFYTAAIWITGILVLGSMFVGGWIWIKDSL